MRRDQPGMLLSGDLDLHSARNGLRHLALESKYVPHLTVDQLVPCALIVNELVSNSLKHAFPSNRSGDVRVEIHGHKNFVDLTVADDGIGFSPGKTERQSGVGLQIVQALARQLSGNIHWANGRGMSATVTFPALQ